MRHDLKAERPELYRIRSREWHEVLAPPLRCLTVDGHGDPNREPAYARAVETLYATAYAVRAALRERTGEVIVVGPLEGLWTSDDPGSFVRREKHAWRWTMLLGLPDVVDEVDVEAGRDAVRRRRPDLDLDLLERRTLDEGRCLQVLHVGPYDDEGPLLARLHDELMPALGLTWAGPHHEVYLGDPRRAAPERLRTVLRQPVRPADAPMSSTSHD